MSPPDVCNGPAAAVRKFEIGVGLCRGSAARVVNSYRLFVCFISACAQRNLPSVANVRARAYVAVVGAFVFFHLRACSRGCIGRGISAWFVIVSI